MRTIYTMNDAGLNVICAHFDKESDKWIDTVMAFEKLADEQDQTTLDLDGVLVTLGAEHFDEIRIAY
jgi:hypothetical protein